MLESLDDEIRRVALEPDRWPDLLHRLGHNAGALGAILISEAHRVPVPPISHDLAPLMERYYAEGWNERDIRFRGMATVLRNGTVTDNEILSDEEMRTSPYYQELLRPLGCHWFCSLAFEVAGSPWFLTIQRTIKQGPFEPAEVARLLALRRPLRDAGNLSHALAFSRVSGMADAFDNLSRPAVILDERGLLIRCNTGAEQILSSMAEIRHREIRFRDGDNQRSFDVALAEGGHSAQWSGRPRSRTVLKDASGRDRAITATALGDWGRYTFTQASHLVLFDDVRDEMTPAARWQERYGLTTAEVRIAEALIAGLSVRAIADRHGIAYETARTHIKSVLFKTDTRRQTELVSRLLHGIENDQ